jgi:hypothetical protein
MSLDSVEAEAWYVHRLRGGLRWPRSPELRPSNLHLGEAQQATDEAPWQAAVEFVVRERRKRLPSPLVAAPGRIVAFQPGETLSDGAADAVTAGFFDLNNTPPWDTWVGFREGTLYAWIPQALEIVVQEAIEVNPEQCLKWATQGWKLQRRANGRLEAVCQHGVGHGLGIHGCDLCCQSPDFPANRLRAFDHNLHGM